MNIGFRLVVALLLILLGVKPLEGSEKPHVPHIAVSITPFYALVAAVIKNTGIPAPKLLVKPGASPHQYALRPSDLRALQDADLIFWAGPQYETFLTRPLDNLKQQRPYLKVIAFESIPDLIKLPVRQGANWEPHQHDADDHHHHSHHDSDLIDMHFWLDPHNAILITDTIVHELSKLDPTHATLYQKNGRDLKNALQALDSRLSEKLKPVRTIPFIVFHDAYQYFQHRYHLNIVGSITIHPEAPPSAKRISEIRSTISKTKVKCVFVEPQFQPKLVESLIKDLKIHGGELDPIGSKDENNPDGYLILLNRLATSIHDCLEKAP